MRVLKSLQARALLLQQVRAFFLARKVLEVETPLLSHAIGTDPQLSPMQVSYQEQAEAVSQNLFLQTSPEFAMKRLLADGSGAIFQVSKAFRNGEVGSRHNPEFTMLEWYRPGKDEFQLMDEVAELIETTLGINNIQRRSYKALFQHYLNIDPHTASLVELEQKARDTLDIAFSSDEIDIWLDLLYSHLIEPELTEPVFIYHYPKSQAALARTGRDEEGTEIARRFELVIAGMELANGYYELTDAQEQQRRFKADQATRERRGLPQHPLDMNFLAALQKGLPDCAGVALGLDRLLMLIEDATNIAEVIPYTVDLA